MRHFAGVASNGIFSFCSEFDGPLLQLLFISTLLCLRPKTNLCIIVTFLWYAQFYFILFLLLYLTFLASNSQVFRHGVLLLFSVVLHKLT